MKSLLYIFSALVYLFYTDMIELQASQSSPCKIRDGKIRDVHAICPPAPKRSKISHEFEKPQSKANTENSVSYVPGAFNPPHKNHLSLAQEAFKEANHIIIVLFNNGIKRHGIDFETSKDIWRLYLEKICQAEECALEDKEDLSVKTYEIKEDDFNPHNFIFIDLRSMFKSCKNIDHVFIQAGDEKNEGIDYEIKFSHLIDSTRQNVYYRIHPKQSAISATKFSYALTRLLARLNLKDSKQSKKYDSIPDDLYEESLQFLPHELCNADKLEVIEKLLFDLDNP